MARAAKFVFKVLPLCVAAIGFAAPPAVGAERWEPGDSLAGRLAVNAAITLDLARGAAASRFRQHAGGLLRGFPGKARLFVVAPATSGRSNALRIDLFRFEVTRAPADSATDGLAKTFPSSVVRVGVTEGAMSESKAVGITMRLAPNLVIESRIGPHRESDTAIRFKLQF